MGSALRERLAPSDLHHLSGHDLDPVAPVFVVRACQAFRVEMRLSDRIEM
jgi:hypothetical protein